MHHFSSPHKSPLKNNKRRPKPVRVSSGALAFEWNYYTVPFKGLEYEKHALDS